MKKIIIAVIVLVAGMSVASAQVQPGMKYRELKSMYNTKGYVKSDIDPYAPVWTGIASYLLPGLGQAIVGETGRGLRFFAASTVISSFSSYTADQLIDNIVKDDYGAFVKDESGNYQLKDKAAAKRQVMALCAAGISELIVCIWSSADAAKVAKVKNLYYRDVRKYTLEPSLYPSVQTVQTGTGCRLAPGMTFALNF